MLDLTVISYLLRRWLRSAFRWLWAEVFRLRHVIQVDDHMRCTIITVLLIWIFIFLSRVNNFNSCWAAAAINLAGAAWVSCWLLSRWAQWKVIRVFFLMALLYYHWADKGRILMRTISNIKILAQLTYLTYIVGASWLLPLSRLETAALWFLILLDIILL